MTARLIALLTVVLFLSLAAFAALLAQSQDRVMDEVTRTVSTVGSKTLATLFEHSLDEEGVFLAAGAWTPAPHADGGQAELGCPPGPAEGLVLHLESRHVETDPPPPGGPTDAAEGGSSRVRRQAVLPGTLVKAESGPMGEVRARMTFVRQVFGDAQDVQVVVLPVAGGEPRAAVPAAEFREEVDFHVSTRDFADIFAGLRRTSLLAFLGVFAVGAVLTAGVARRLTRPIRRLDSGLRTVSEGDLDVELEARGDDEVARVTRAFNDMARRLRHNRDRSRELMRQEKLSALGRLAASVAHEVRNPLHAMNLIFQHMRETCPPQDGAARAEFERCLGLLRGEIRRLDGMVGNFLRFARRDGGRRERVDVGALLRETAELVAREAQRQGVDLRVETPPPGESPPPPVEAVIESLRSSLLNLVLNALQAMPDGGALTLRALAAPRAAVLEVEDTGPGIPRSDRERVFEFGYTTRDGGSGLGLPLVHQVVVEEHAGVVELLGDEGQGTVVRLSLPAAAENAK